MFVSSDKLQCPPLLSNIHRWLSQILPSDPRALVFLFFFFFASFISATLPHRVNLVLAHALMNIYLFGCLTPHTHLASLVSRTQATRTVMSSMRSWIQQLWPPLPAHEAPLTLAQGILSSMQPSSLAHTSACHYRPFPSDFGLKVHRPMYSFPRLTLPPPPPSPPLPPPFLVCLPLQPFCFLRSHCSVLTVE